MEYLNRERIERVSHESFQRQQPYPWVDIEGILTPEGHELLRQTLPDASMFDRRVGVKRAFGQGYHDRYILHYHPSLDLAEPWKDFVAELHGKTYESLIRRMFGLRRGARFVLTLEWYYAWQGCGVSPHCDARRKLGTHIFYFNTEADWESSWGGRILIMDDGGRLKTHSAPEFDDLGVAASLDPRGNGSLLFQRTAHSWHGVRPLESPPGHMRKLFIVTINVPTIQVLWRRVRGKDPDGYPLKNPEMPHSIPA
ncbi:MAG: 2OG-Fe(II) oxygenase [Isosphaeraceae bacterium]